MLGKFFGKKDKEEEVVQPLPTPLNLRIGAMVSVDTLDLELFFGGQSLVDIKKASKNRIKSYSKIELDQDTFIHRFNFEGGFFEIMGNEDASDFDDDSITWYQILHSTPLLPDDVDTWKGEEGMIGSSVFSLDGGEDNEIDYYRVLFDDRIDENISLEVDVKCYTDEITHSDTTLDMMLFGRDIENGADCEAEFLIAEVEDSEEKSVANIYIGVTIAPSLIEVI